MPVDLNYQSQITSFSDGQGSTLYSSSFQYNTDTITSDGLPPLHLTSVECSTRTPDSSIPKSPNEFGNDKRRKRGLATYDAPWWRYYE
jgi:hypothetical protein